MTESPSGPRAKLSGRALIGAVAGAVALIIAIVVIASNGGSDDSAGPTTTVTGSTVAAAATSTTAAAIVTVAGNVTEVIDAGGFVVNDGTVDYTINVSSATKFAAAVGGAARTQADIKVGGLVQIIGDVNGSTISANSVFLTVGTQAPSTAPQDSSAQTSQP